MALKEGYRAYGSCAVWCNASGGVGVALQLINVGDIMCGTHGKAVLVGVSNSNDSYQHRKLKSKDDFNTELLGISTQPSRRKSLVARMA